MSDHAVHVAPQAKYWYRRSLRPLELLPAIGAALGGGLVAFYLARLFLERTPLLEATRERPVRRHAGRPARDASASRAVFRR